MYEYGACINTDEPSITCNFEYDNICGYTNDPSGQFQWVRHTGASDRVGTGPQGDVTTGTENGHFMLIEASAPKKTGDMARIISPVKATLGFNYGNCLYFYYHAYGPDVNVGELNVYSIKDVQYVADNNSTKSKNLLWSVNRNVGDQWYIANVPASYSYDYRIIFEGKLLVS